MSDTDKTPAFASLVELEHEVLARYCEGIKVDGAIAQSVELKLKRGHGIWTSRGALLAYNDKVDWTLKVPGGAGAAVSRALSGAGMALVRIEATRPGAEVVLSAN